MCVRNKPSTAFGLIPACFSRITAPRPASNSSFLPPASTSTAAPNRWVSTKGVPVPSSTTVMFAFRCGSRSLPAAGTLHPGLKSLANQPPQEQSERFVSHEYRPFSGTVRPASPAALSLPLSCFRRFLFRSRVEKKLAHLAGHIAGDGSLLRPCKCLIQIGRFQYPESAHVLLGLGVRSVGDQHPAVGLLPQRLRAGGRGNPAGELPGAGSNQFAVERVDLLHHRFGYGGRVEVVGEVVSDQILWHDFFSLASVVCSR